ncbi:MAG: hypothetical protein HY074_10810 [Deltaproteobacteria bacterium]|nr:hypothetical protein [Deltaproteobacteria bacterium]
MILTWLTALACAHFTLAGPVTLPSADTILQSRLLEVEQLIEKKNYSEAIRKALSNFNLNATNCRGIDTRFIEGRDENGSEVIAHTQLDQIVVLDPRQTGFQSARFLVSLLAHETTHCDQNQQLYTLALNADPALAPLKDKVALLRVLADLDELAAVALKDTPVKADANAKFKLITARHGLDVTPQALVAMARQFMADVVVYKKNLAELHEMEASLRAFELPGVLTPPKAQQKASEEFAFQYRFLLMSTNHFVKTRQLAGFTGDMACRLGNLVPYAMTLQHERTCAESVRLVKDFLAKIPE